MESPNDDAQQAKTSKPSYPKLLDGKYFEVIKCDGTKIDAKCKTCGKVRKGNLKSTGNFTDHYRTQHPSMLQEIDQYKKSKEQIVAENALKQSTLLTLKSTFTTQVVSFSSYKYMLLNINI